jgi:hypothetical protein
MFLVTDNVAKLLEGKNFSRLTDSYLHWTTNIGHQLNSVKLFGSLTVHFNPEV